MIFHNKRYQGGTAVIHRPCIFGCRDFLVYCKERAALRSPAGRVQDMIHLLMLMIHFKYITAVSERKM